jgi:ABC-2 type transport system permease protein
VLIGTVAYLTGRPAARFVVAEHFGRPFEPVVDDPAVPLAATTCIAATIAPLRMAEQRLSRLE